MLDASLKREHRGRATSDVLLQRNSASAHTSQAGVAAAAELGYAFVLNPPDPPDLAPTDFL